MVVRLVYLTFFIYEKENIHEICPNKSLGKNKCLKITFVMLSSWRFCRCRTCNKDERKVRQVLKHQCLVIVIVDVPPGDDVTLV